jgi:hypothetical protein
MAAICCASAGIIAQVESGLAGYRAAPGHDAGVWRDACNGSNTGHAIGPLERLFPDSALELSAADRSFNAAATPGMRPP